MTTARRQRSRTPRSIWLRRLSPAMRRMVVDFVLRRKVELSLRVGHLARELDERLRRLRAVAVAVPGEHERARRDPRAEGEHLDRAVARIDHQLRLDRGAEVLGDEGAERAVVVGAEHDVQLRYP